MSRSVVQADRIVAFRAEQRKPRGVDAHRRQVLGQHFIDLCLVEGSEQAGRQRAQAVERPALIHHVLAKLLLHDLR